MTDTQTWTEWFFTVDTECLAIAAAVGFITLLAAFVHYRFQAAKILSAFSLFEPGQGKKSPWDWAIGVMYLAFVIACWYSNPFFGVIVEVVPLVARRKLRTAVSSA